MKKGIEFDFNDDQKTKLKEAREKLSFVQDTTPSFDPAYKVLSGIILSIETLLGVMQ